MAPFSYTISTFYHLFPPRLTQLPGRVKGISRENRINAGFSRIFPDSEKYLKKPPDAHPTEGAGKLIGVNTGRIGADFRNLRLLGEMVGNYFVKSDAPTRRSAFAREKTRGLGLQSHGYSRYECG